MDPGFLAQESVLLSPVHCVYCLNLVKSQGWQYILFGGVTGEEHRLLHLLVPYLDITPP